MARDVSVRAGLAYSLDMTKWAHRGLKSARVRFASWKNFAGKQDCGGTNRRWRFPPHLTCSVSLRFGKSGSISAGMPT